MKAMAVRGALLAAALAACAPSASAQIKATGTVEIGPGDVSDNSFKAGEYNGLENRGGYGIGNIDLRGGSAGYNSDGTVRWRIKGTDLGLQTRSVSAEVGRQGQFRFTFVYDELRRNRSDTYQTPYDGAGSSLLTLPGPWMVPTVAGSSTSNNAVNVVSTRGLIPQIGGAAYIDSATNSPSMGRLLAPTSAQLLLVNAAANADNPLFHTVDLFTNRRRFDAAFRYSFDQQWSIDANVSPEHKTGLKPMGTVSRSTGADIATVIPDVIDADHNQMSVNLVFKSTKAFTQASYYGSFFANHNPSMSWQNWATPAATLNTISGAPGNQFNQFTVTSGVNISAHSKLVGNASYGRATQNDAFITDATTLVVPVSSLHGIVVTSSFGAKFTAQPAKKFNVAAAYKYDDRDNRTSVHIFQYADAGDAPAPNINFPAGPSNPFGAVVAQNANANRPYSRTLNLANVDAEYAVAKHQWVKAGYDFERINRRCNDTWISCVDAAITNENTVRADWRANVGELSARVGYAYSIRRTPDYNENAFLALVPYASVAPAAATGGATALSFMNANGWTGWGPAAGYAPTTGNLNLFFPNNNALANALYANNNRISELPGLRRYYVADRNRNRVRSLLSWQATDSLSVQSGVDLNKDAYPNSIYGVRNARGWAANVDGSYAFAEDFSATVFYAYENQRASTAGNSYTANSNAATLAGGQPGAVGLSGNTCDPYLTLQQRNNNNKLDPCLNWSSDMLENTHTVGVALRKKLGNVNLTGSLTFSHARWDSNVAGGSWTNNILNGSGAAPTTIAAFFIPATPLPTISTDTGEFRLTAGYAFDTRQSVRLSYARLRMQSSDLAYEGMQLGSVSSLLPTNEQPFKYGINVVGVAYTLSF
jgi:MtrB/PioB family decaheme-associated outer membrane protein